MESSSGIIHVWQLPLERICVGFESELQISIIKEAISVCGNKRKLSETVGVNRITLIDIEKSRFNSISFNSMLKLLGFLVSRGFEDYSLKKLERHIKIIKAMRAKNSINNPKFPINFNSKEGAQIIAGILFDGGITREMFPFYTNNEFCLTSRFIRNLRRVVGNIDFNERINKRNREKATIQLEFPKILGYILVYGIGVSPGKKILTNPRIPEFIIKGKKNIRRAFLQQAFDDEGSVHTSLKGRSIQLTQYHKENKPPIRLLQLKQIIENINISINGPYFIREYNSAKGHKSYGWNIEISNQSNIWGYARQINFSIPRKRQALLGLLNSYILPPRYKKGQIKEEIIRACQKLKNDNKKLTIKNIAKEVERNEIWIAEIIRDLVNEGKIIVTIEKRSPNISRGGFLPKEFDLVDNL